MAFYRATIRLILLVRQKELPILRRWDPPWKPEKSKKFENQIYDFSSNNIG